MPNQNIVQRRSNGHSSSTLPITNDDLNPKSTGKRRPRRGVSPYDRHSLLRWVILIVVSMSAAGLLWKPISSLFGLKSRQSAHGQRKRREQEISSSSNQAGHEPRVAGRSPLPLPLSQFSELSFALQNSDLVALYFAASWCPMSTPVSLALDGAFGEEDALLSREGGGRKTLSVVYVSSDRTSEEYDGYLRNRNWLAVPYESPQRSQIKKHFSTCAHRELNELGIDRKHEIPTIIVIDSQTQGVITTNGADDIDQMGEGALEHWKEMQSWIRKAAEGMK